jgi:uncharacterized protein
VALVLTIHGWNQVYGLHSQVCNSNRRHRGQVSSRDGRVGSSFVVENEEWYTYDKSPRSNVHVLARVDETTYSPDTKTKMGGDHPVVWTNEHYKARNVYIFMGHHPELFENAAFTKIFHNSILWAANQ